MIRKGQRFDTPFERGCVALESPNSHGSFLALDSDGVRADFHVAMVENVRDVDAATIAAEVADALTPRSLRPADEDHAGGRNTLTRFADLDEA
jgi:hypothetical protein